MINPRTKGASGEREAIALLTGWAAEVSVPLALDRNLEQVRYGGADINGVPGMEIEVKRQQKTAVNTWWRQVCEAADKSGKLPFLIHRANHQPWRVRTRIWAALYCVTGEGTVVDIEVDMELPAAKMWFQEYVRQNTFSI